MKYLIRTVKYFFYFAFLATAVIVALVLVGAVEGDINEIFTDGPQALWKMALMFAAFAAVYPKVGFINRSTMVSGSWDELHDGIIGFFDERHYELESEEEGMLAFRIRGNAGRLSRMYEDRIIVRNTADGLTVEGLRKDVMRLSAGLEYRFRNDKDE